MDRIDFNQSNRTKSFGGLIAFVSTAAIAAPVPAWAASGDDSTLSTLSAYAWDALAILLWVLNSFGITVRGLMVLACVVAVPCLVTWLTIKVFYLGKRAAGG